MSIHQTMHFSQTPYQRRLLVRLSVALGVIAVLSGLIIFWGLDIGETRSSVEKLEVEFARRLSMMRELAEARAGVRQAAAPQKKLWSVIPEKEKLIDLSQNLQRIAQRENLGYTFAYIEESPSVPPEPGSIRFRISLDGTFDEFAAFLRGLRAFQYITRVDEVLVNYNKMEVVGAVFFR